MWDPDRKLKEDSEGHLRERTVKSVLRLKNLK